MREPQKREEQWNKSSHAFFVKSPNFTAGERERARRRGCFAAQLSIMKIGRRIKEVFDAMPKGCTVVWFAAQLNCERCNVYRIFERENIDMQLLARISRVLNHDFFKDLSDELTPPSE